MWPSRSHRTVSKVGAPRRVKIFHRPWNYCELFRRCSQAAHGWELLRCSSFHGASWKRPARSYRICADSLCALPPLAQLSCVYQVHPESICSSLNCQHEPAPASTITAMHCSAVASKVRLVRQTPALTVTASRRHPSLPFEKLHLPNRRTLLVVKAQQEVNQPMSSTAVPSVVVLKAVVVSKAFLCDSPWTYRHVAKGSKKDIAIIAFLYVLLLPLLFCMNTIRFAWNL